MLISLLGVLLSTSLGAGTPAPLELIGIREAVLAAYELTADARLEATMHAVEKGTLPASNAEAGLPPPSEIAAPEPGVAGVEIRNGTIVVRFSDEAGEHLAGQTIGISPCKEASGLIYWACGQAVCPERAPAASGAPPAFTLTTVGNDLLPAHCRGVGEQILAFRAASDAGDPQGQAFWSAILWSGIVVPRDQQRALELATASAEQGHISGMAALANFLRIGADGILEPDLVQSYIWWGRADAAGHPEATIYQQQLVPSLTEAQIEAAEQILKASPDEPAGGN